ncbi:MAG: DUF2283 domain-containing protein [Acidobacteria bacterium]|nr:DUF2283 domain-containing protein [Acidobacteriota bacterium]
MSSRSTRHGARATKYEYDRESDVLLITLSREKPDYAEQSRNIITHYSKKGKPIEIEILDASKEAVDIIKAILPKKGVAA